MTVLELSGENQGNLWGSLQPYAQLIRALLPRASNVAVFDTDGKLRWSSDHTTGPDVLDLIDGALQAARADSKSAGLVRVLEGNQPVYVCWLRDEAEGLLAIVAILCRASASGSAEGEPRAFSFVHALLRPALECLRRDLLARASIAGLQGTVTQLDNDLELLLADAAHVGSTGSADELKTLVQGAIEHLKCGMAALIVPDKGIALLRATRDLKPDGQLLARTHRQLVSMAQLRPDPLIINRVAPSPSIGVIPYRILSCPVRNAGGRTVGVMALFRDQLASEFTARDARLAEVLARRASSVIETQYDALSGLFTRQALEQRIRAAFAERTRATAWTALYLDVDQLHVVNDNFGMHIGDAVLGQLGELIRGRLPPGALAARIAGDRFAVLLPSDIEDAMRFAEALRAGAELLGTANANARFHVSMSGGVAALESGSGALAHALAAAETACKAAKDRGRNRIELFAAEDSTIARRFADIHVAARLREAIGSERLRLDAQVVVPFDGVHARPHYELLLRMIGEDGATVGPDSFLTAANRYQLMPAIDRWVIEHALALLSPHATMLAGRPAAFAINCSGQSLCDDGFGDFLQSALESSGLDPALFCFELTESATIMNLGRAEVLMRRLRRLGCGIALDHFGTGLSSLSYLRQLPLTMLKIDGSFVRDILKDSRAESMVQAIAQLARSMSFQTVGEYVETEEIRARLATLGVDFGQGFALGRPEPFEDVLAQLPMLAAAVPAYTGSGGAPPPRIANLR
jgi:diguanylate cyclase (GGDEF)-like protein